MEIVHRKLMTDLNDEYISSTEAEKILGLRPYAIQKLIKRGTVPAEKIANRWLVSKTFVEEFAKTYVPKVGRPRTKRKYTRRKQQ